MSRSIVCGDGSPRRTRASRSCCCSCSVSAVIQLASDGARPSRRGSAVAAGSAGSLQPAPAARPPASSAQKPRRSMLECHAVRRPDDCQLGQTRRLHVSFTAVQTSTPGLVATRRSGRHSPCHDAFEPSSPTRTTQARLPATPANTRGRAPGVRVVTHRGAGVRRRHERQHDIVRRDRRAGDECDGRLLLDATRNAGIEAVLAVERGSDPEHARQGALREERRGIRRRGVRARASRPRQSARCRRRISRSAATSPRAPSSARGGPSARRRAPCGRPRSRRRRVTWMCRTARRPMRRPRCLALPVEAGASVPDRSAAPVSGDTARWRSPSRNWPTANKGAPPREPALAETPRPVPRCSQARRSGRGASTRWRSTAVVAARAGRRQRADRTSRAGSSPARGRA